MSEANYEIERTSGEKHRDSKREGNLDAQGFHWQWIF